MKIVLYGKGCRKSAKVIGNHLDLPVRRIPQHRDQVIIRWGTSRRAIDGEEGAINQREAIYLASNKFIAFETLAENNITVPMVWKELDNEIVYPCLSRTKHHRQGRDIELIDTAEKAEIALQSGRVLVELLNLENEYRVHVIDGEPAKVFRKTKLTEDADNLIRTARCGWGFYRIAQSSWLNPMLDKAVESANILGLFFSALDIAHTTGHRFVVLEANTAPSLVHNTPVRNLYLDAIQDWVGERYEISQSVG